MCMDINVTFPINVYANERHSSSLMCVEMNVLFLSAMSVSGLGAHCPPNVLVVTLLSIPTRLAKYQLFVFTGFLIVSLK